MFEVGKHKITVKDRKNICDCWPGFVPGGKNPPHCKCEGCHLFRMEKWIAMTDTEQIADDKRRSGYAKAVVAAVCETLDTLTEMKKWIRGIESRG
jgi:hypothetical protein